MISIKDVQAVTIEAISKTREIEKANEDAQWSVLEEFIDKAIQEAAASGKWCLTLTLKFETRRLAAKVIEVYAEFRASHRGSDMVYFDWSAEDS